MSLINDALIKAERDRAEEAAARASSFRPHERAALRRQAKKTRSLGFAVANTAALVAIFATAIAVLIRNRRPDRADVSSPVTAMSASLAATKPTDTKASANVTTPAIAPEPITRPKAPPPYELAGMSSLGNSTLLSILRRSDHRSVWVQVGQSVGEITAVSYDPKTDQAVIRVDDELFKLPLRTGATAEPTTQAAE